MFPLDLGSIILTCRHIMSMQYSKKDNGYLVPEVVVDVVVGGPNGKAVVRTPENGGFTEPALKTLFTRAFTPSPRKPTRVPPATVEAKKKKLISIIVPIVVGVLLLAILIGFFIINCRKKQREQLLAKPMVGYRGHYFIELTSHNGPMHRTTLQPQELPAEYYTLTKAKKNGGMMSGTISLGLAIAEKLCMEKARDHHFSPISELESEEEQWNGHANATMPGRAPGSFNRRSMGPIVPLGVPPPWGMNSIKTLPPLPSKPAEVTAQSNLNGAIGTEGNSSEHQAHPVFPATPTRKSSQKSARRTQEEREMLASGPYYPLTPSNDNDSLMSMPTPTCEPAGFARIVSPVAVVATNRMSRYKVNRSGTEKGERPPRLPVPVVPLEKHNLEEV
ncbi:hypothetical protein EV426DRAFT_673581 [Tirmania nivea]|nr:hypothetical protein EV426DRAFT_673581 [Tirmania nivea]